MNIKGARTKTSKKAKGKAQSSVREGYTIGSVERALRILDELGATTRRWGLTFSELKDDTKIPSGSLHYLLRTLVQSGYLRYDSDKRLYTLGIRLMTLGAQVIRSMKVREEEALKLLQNIVRKTNLGAHLAVLDGDDAVYVQRVEAPGFFVAKIWPGRRQIPHVTAVGKALICCFNEDQIKTLLERHSLSRKEHPKAIMTQSALREELMKVRKRGYATDDQEHAPNVRCVAAPVYAESAEVIAAIGVSGTTAEVAYEDLDRIGMIVQNEARELSRQLRSMKRLRGSIQQLMES